MSNLLKSGRLSGNPAATSQLWDPHPLGPPCALHLPGPSWRCHGNRCRKRVWKHPQKEELWVPCCHHCSLATHLCALELPNRQLALSPALCTRRGLSRTGPAGLPGALRLPWPWPCSQPASPAPSTHTLSTAGSSEWGALSFASPPTQQHVFEWSSGYRPVNIYILAQHPPKFSLKLSKNV